MSIESAIGRIREIQDRITAFLPGRLRPCFAGIDTEHRGIIVTGARGVGKTTFLISRMADLHALYLPADNPIVASYPLYDLIEASFQQGYEGIVVDEVHFAKDWSTHIKAAFDAFPDRFIWASDSSTVVLRRDGADFSRRFLTFHIPLMSFREYLCLETGHDFPVIDPFQPDGKRVQETLQSTNVLRAFHEYCSHGFRPMYLEDPDSYQERVMNTIKKSLEADIPYLIPRLSDNHLHMMRAVIGFLASSSIPRLSVNTLCDRWSLSKDKLYQLLEAMERSHLIRIIRRENDTRMHSVGGKIFLYEPSVYSVYSDSRGNLRESLFAAMAEEAGKAVFASRDEAECDFIVNGITVEVGGRTRKRKKADLVVRDDTDMPSGNSIPLWLTGMWY